MGEPNLDKPLVVTNSFCIGTMSENSDSDSEISEYSDEESIISSPAKKRKIDTTSFKYKIHDVLKPFCNVGSGKFVLSGELQHAPFVYISIKVIEIAVDTCLLIIILANIYI